ncbi:MAG: 30S ribosomal protein S20 [Planctomycetes bacterium]|nr:30S ribosomal protein S20 [Planctomycetota bacterium]
MAHSTQAKKRIRQNEKRRLHNKTLASRMRTEVKKLRQLIEDGDGAGAAAQLPVTMKLLDKAAKHHVIHANTASRQKSRLSLAIRRATASA